MSPLSLRNSRWVISVLTQTVVAPCATAVIPGAASPVGRRGCQPRSAGQPVFTGYDDRRPPKSTSSGRVSTESARQPRHKSKSLSTDRISGPFLSDLPDRFAVTRSAFPAHRTRCSSCELGWLVVSVMSAVDELTRADVSVDLQAMPAFAVGELLVQIERASRALEALRAEAIGRFDAAGGAAADGSRSTAAWLRHHCQFTPGEAKEHVQTARALRELPLTMSALASGRIAYASAAAICSLAADAPPEVMRSTESEMLTAADCLNPADLRRFVGRLRYTYAREAVRRDEASRYQLRQFHLASTFDKLGAVQGWLLPEVAAGLRVLLENRMSPPAPDDDRTRSQRMHDALAAWIEESLSTGDVRHDGGERPHVTVVVDLQTLRDAPGAPPALLERYGPITGEAARRLCCDAQVARVITDGKSEILDAGRLTRTITPAQRRALIVRDGDTCVVSGCTTPTRWCQVHHLKPWFEGGPTDLDNLGYVCLSDHHDVHEGGNTLRRHPGGRWEKQPP